MLKFKHCRLCDLDKPLVEFYRNKRERDGYRTECKTCYRDMPSVKAQWKGMHVDGSPNARNTK